jgi:hypothetical protein
MDKPFKIDDEYGELTRDVLYQEYVANGLNDSQIAKKYSIGSKTTVWRRRKFFGIPNRYSLKSNKHASVNRKVIVSLDDASRMLSDGKTHQEIATAIGASRISVFRRLQELGLTSEIKHSQNKLRWHAGLTDGQIKFLLGTVLGDGNLTRGGLFQCNHSAKQEQYIRHKMDMLRSLLPPDFDLTPVFPSSTKEGARHPAFHLRTQQNETLKSLYVVFYPNGVKVFPYEYLAVSMFDASSLAYWYMDDGSRKGNSAELATYGFGFAGNAKILAFLKERFGIVGVLAEDNSPARSPDAKHYIRFNKDEATKLFTIVAPHIVASMEYKIPPEYRIVRSG